MTMSAIEALTNAAVGLVVSWAITFLALPLWGLQPSAMQAGGITGMYFVVSLQPNGEWLTNGAKLTMGNGPSGDGRVATALLAR